MEFNVVQLLKERTGETRDYAIENEEVRLADGDDRSVVNGRVHLLRTHDGILAEADLTLTADESCARCLQGFTTTLPVHIEEVYYPTLDVETGERIEPPVDSEGFLIDKHHILDLVEPVRQYRWIAEEFAPLCRPDCKGLCPDCGIDLNAEPGHEHETPVDSRWSALAELAGRIDKERN